MLKIDSNKIEVVCFKRQCRLQTGSAWSYMPFCSFLLHCTWCVTHQSSFKLFRFAYSGWISKSKIAFVFISLLQLCICFWPSIWLCITRISKLSWSINIQCIKPFIRVRNISRSTMLNSIKPSWIWFLQVTRRHEGLLIFIHLLSLFVGLLQLESRA